MFGLIEQLYVLQHPKPGTREWLILKEKKYGGYVNGVPRHKASSKDPRPIEKLRSGGMIGGDRMSRKHQGYAAIYARHLRLFVERQESVTLVEVGVLKGTGLAIWCDLFPGSRIIGLDIDLKNVLQNMDGLKAAGAFRRGTVEFYEFDQFEDNHEYMSSILGGGKIDIVIDDGAHFEESIVATLQSMLPFLREQFVYFIEDNDEVCEVLRVMFPNLAVWEYGKMTVLAPPVTHNLGVK